MCKISWSNSKKRREEFPGTQFWAFNLNQPVWGYRFVAKTMTCGSFLRSAWQFSNFPVTDGLLPGTLYTAFLRPVNNNRTVCIGVVEIGLLRVMLRTQESHSLWLREAVAAACQCATTVVWKIAHHAGVGGNTCASPAGGSKSYSLCIISCSISGICFSTPCFRLAPWSKADPIPPGLETSTLTLGMYPPARPCDNTDPTTYTDIVLHAVGHVPYMEKSK